MLSVTDASTGKGYSIYSAMTAASNTGYAGYFTNSGTAGSYGIYATTASAGTGYGVYASITGSGNTGYAGYFVNSDTSSAVNYSVYGSDASSSGYGISPTTTAGMAFMALKQAATTQRSAFTGPIRVIQVTA